MDVRDYDLEALRDQVAMVLQKNVLFSGTIAENLRWGNPNATDEEIRHAAQLAQADGFVQEFPDKYDTYIEQGGTNVSGGQRQRLCIAQRVASVQESDMILVMDSGRIMASGTHDELLATCDEYRSIYESQTKNQAQPEELAAAEQAAESSTAEPSETVTVTVTMPTADTSAADANAADTKEGEAR